MNLISGCILYLVYLRQLIPPALAAAEDPLPDLLQDTDPDWPELLELAQDELPPDEELELELDPDEELQVAAFASLVGVIIAVAKKAAIVQIAIADKILVFFMRGKIISNYYRSFLRDCFIKLSHKKDTITSYSHISDNHVTTVCHVDYPDGLAVSLIDNLKSSEYDILCICSANF